MPEDIKEPKQERNARWVQERKAERYFLSLKRNYENQRRSWEQRWDQAIAAVYQTDDLDEIYAGRAHVKSPIMHWKVNSIVSRFMRVLFTADPWFRLEDPKKTGQHDDITELWNPYMQRDQLPAIDFKNNFKLQIQNKAIQGTAISKVTQEYETKSLNYFEAEDVEAEEVVVKDNPYFRPLLLTEFYSDVNKHDINESQACIHSTVMSLDELHKNRKRKIKQEIEIMDEAGNVVATDTETVEVGIYDNVELLEYDERGNSFTAEQREFMDVLGLQAGEGDSVSSDWLQGLKENKRSGHVEIDECYGKYFLDGEWKEVICVIANKRVVLRLEETPFVHKKHIRPFIVGRYFDIPNCLYGLSPVMVGKQLLMELNATRSQAVDAKTRAISPMWYRDKSQQIKWDGKWTPDGVIEGIGPTPPLQPLITPYLGDVSSQNLQLIQRDIDQLWGLSPVQEGTTDPNFVPDTRGGTLAVIAQNDYPLNELINRTIDKEIKPFLEMVFERNLIFKTPEDLLSVWNEQELMEFSQKMGINLAQADMRQFFFDANVRILGNLELSNELSHQAGYLTINNAASVNPQLAGLVKWKSWLENTMQSFGIKDDVENMVYSDEELQARSQQQQQAEQQKMQMEMQARVQAEQMRLQAYEREKQIDAEAKVVEENAVNTHESELNKNEEANKAVLKKGLMEWEAQMEQRYGASVRGSV